MATDPMLMMMHSSAQPRPTTAYIITYKKRKDAEKLAGQPASV